MTKHIDLTNINELKERLGKWSKVAKYYGISERTLFNYRKNKSFIKENLDQNNIYSLNNICKRLKNESFFEVANSLGMNENVLKRYIEVLKSNHTYAKNEQKYRDITNAKGKHFREYVRVDNSIEELSTSIFETLNNTNFNNEIIKVKNDENKYMGIIHWSDLHFNEYVNIESNQYNWEIASKRLRKHVQYCMDLFRHFKVTDVFIAGTGDFLNSDRRLDELMINCDNRAKAIVLAYDLLRQAILEISKEFNVYCAFICGNESRLDLDIQNTKKLVSNNFDYTLSLMLNAYFKNCSNVNIFIPENPEECIINLMNKNILLIHGHKGFSSDIESSVSKIISKYSKTKHCNIDYVLFGHIHSAYISDNFARSGSLTGDNEYSFNKLQLTSKASQNCYLVSENSIHGFKVDLQNVDGIKGYDYDKNNETYYSLSKDKCKDYEQIIKIVI